MSVIRREFQPDWAQSVDRLGRSLQDLIGWVARATDSATPSAFWTHRQDFWKSLTALTGGYAPVRFHTAASLLAPDGHDPADGSHERRRGRGERRPS
jgi:hypothetical protein